MFLSLLIPPPGSESHIDPFGHSPLQDIPAFDFPSDSRSLVAYAIDLLLRTLKSSTNLSPSPTLTLFFSPFLLDVIGLQGSPLFSPGSGQTHPFAALGILSRFFPSPYERIGGPFMAEHAPFPLG